MVKENVSRPAGRVPTSIHHFLYDELWKEEEEEEKYKLEFSSSDRETVQCGPSLSVTISSSSVHCGRLHAVLLSSNRSLYIIIECTTERTSDYNKQDETYGWLLDHIPRYRDSLFLCTNTGLSQSMMSS